MKLSLCKTATPWSGRMWGVCPITPSPELGWWPEQAAVTSSSSEPISRSQLFGDCSKGQSVKGRHTQRLWASHLEELLPQLFWAHPVVPHGDQASPPPLTIFQSSIWTTHSSCGRRWTGRCCQCEVADPSPCRAQGEQRNSIRVRDMWIPPCLCTVTYEDEGYETP